jgi:hypothetical protein
VTVSGTVSSIDKETLSFVIVTTQYVDGSQGRDNLHIRGRIKRGPRWREPEKRLPRVDSVVHFEGVLEEIEEADGHQNAVVLLDFIVYHSKVKTDSLAEPAGEDEQNILLRAEKYSQDNPDSNQSQKTLGKRKATHSEDEVSRSMESDKTEDSDAD